MYNNNNKPLSNYTANICLDIKTIWFSLISKSFTGHHQAWFGFSLCLAQSQFLFCSRESARWELSPAEIFCVPSSHQDCTAIAAPAARFCFSHNALKIKLICGGFFFR